jgi:hypothetical protein
MLTTVDNPFDPFNEFESWYAYDMQAGYNTTGLLARIARTSDELSEPDNSLAIEQAIDEIVRINASGVHRKVSRNSSVVSSSD